MFNAGYSGYFYAIHLLRIKESPGGSAPRVYYCMPTPPARRNRANAPRIALLVARWGGWPGWTPLYLRALAANRALVDFHLLTDALPAWRERAPA